MEQQENHLEYYSLFSWVSFSSLDTLFYDDIRQRSTCGIGGINTLCWLLNYHCWMDFVWTFATSFSDKEYLKCTSQVFSYKPHPKKDWQFYSWGQVETFSLMRIKGGRSSRDFYTIEVHFNDKDLLKTNSLWNRLRSRFSTAKQTNVLKIPIYLLDVGLPRRVFETMSYFEREWRIQQNRQRNQNSKSKKKERFH